MFHFSSRTQNHTHNSMVIIWFQQVITIDFITRIGLEETLIIFQHISTYWMEIISFLYFFFTAVALIIFTSMSKLKWEKVKEEIFLWWKSADV